MGEDGLRVMAGGVPRPRRRDRSTPTATCSGYVEELEITSLVGMVDPPRAASKQAVADAQKAHIRVRMVTGDDVVTGAAIAKQLGIEGEAILGAEFAALDESERLARIDGIGVVGRVAPEHKVLLVDTLKQKGDVVAMTGDGVNDAPSIKAAHIGIAMGSGTEVAKNAGRMILTDDDFATIVHAVEQGRKLYDNLTKYVRFVLISLVAFVLTFLGATLLNIAAGQPFTPAQVLWIHFFISAPFGVALGLDQATPGLMRSRPRPSSESIMTRGVKLTSGLVGLYMAICLGRAHLLRQAALRQHRGRLVDRADGVRADARRRGLREPQHDRLRARRARASTTRDELDRAGGDRARGDGHADGPLQPAARHDAAHRRAVRAGARRRRCCCWRSGRSAS